MGGTFTLPDDLKLIDVMHLGRPKAIACYLLLGDEPALVDPGPASALPGLEAGLATRQDQRAERVTDATRGGTQEQVVPRDAARCEERRDLPALHAPRSNTGSFPAPRPRCPRCGNAN